MQTIGDRICEIKTHFYGDKRGSLLKFAEAVGEKSNTVSNWMTREDGVGPAVINKILTAFPEVNKGWLIGGNGSMFSSSNPQSAAIASYEIEIEELRKQLAVVNQMLEARDEKIRDLETQLFMTQRDAV